MKKLASIVCAAALAMALPTLAFAAPSNSNTTTASQGGVTMSVSADSSVEVTAVSNTASNFVQPSSGSYLKVETFDIQPTGSTNANNVKVTVTLNVGSSYSGKYANIFVQHSDGSTQSMSYLIGTDGNVAFSMNKLSYVTLAVSDQPVAPLVGASANATTTKATDKSAKSPQTGQTGLGAEDAAAVSFVLAIAAGGVAVALRKKINE